MKRFISSSLVMLVLFCSVYRALAPIPAGELQVNILPAGAITGGAQWQADGGILRASGTSTFLNVGLRIIHFTKINDWTSPADQQVNIVSGQTITNYATYLPNVTITRTITNTVLVSWSSLATNWIVQQNTNLASTNWITSLQPVADNSANKSIIINSPAGNLFLRLMQ
jgi:hypothetical protein